LHPQFAVRSTGKNLRSLFRELIVEPLGISSQECDIIMQKMGQADFSGVHVRGPGGDQGPAFVHIPFGIWQPEDDDPGAGKAHFASACIFASPREYAKVLRAVSVLSCFFFFLLRLAAIDTSLLVSQCLTHDHRLLQESTWKLVEGDALKDTSITMPRECRQISKGDRRGTDTG
jgi:hypothetical protein